MRWSLSSTTDWHYPQWLRGSLSSRILGSQDFRRACFMIVLCLHFKLLWGLVWISFADYSVGFVRISFGCYFLLFCGLFCPHSSVDLFCGSSCSWQLICTIGLIIIGSISPAYHHGYIEGELLYTIGRLIFIIIPVHMCQIWIALER